MMHSCVGGLGHVLLWRLSLAQCFFSRIFPEYFAG
jgi:hypothetical protein